MEMRGIFKEWEKLRRGHSHLGEEKTVSRWGCAISHHLGRHVDFEFTYHPLLKIHHIFLPWCSSLKLSHQFNLNPDQIRAICTLASAFSKLIHFDGLVRSISWPINRLFNKKMKSVLPPYFFHCLCQQDMMWGHYSFKLVHFKRLVCRKKEKEKEIKK